MRTFLSRYATFCLVVASTAQAQVQKHWARCHNGSGNSEDYGYGVAVDASGNSYVTGGATNALGIGEVVLVKYAKSVGALRLAASHEGRLGRLTTFAMPDIWWRMTELGFNDNLVELFDIDGLDRNYAYYQRSKRC